MSTAQDLRMNLDLFYNVYGKKMYENEQNILFWENYLQNLEALDFSIFAEKLTVPILVPIGSRILFRGELKHTNEVTVALGADYFTKCSVNQAEILKKHRIKDAKSKLDELRKEKDYLQNQLSISKVIYEESGCNIDEVVTEEEDKKWREQHRENVKKYKQRKVEDNETPANEMSNDELWDRLEELELQEELKKELQEDDKHVSNSSTAKVHNNTEGDNENNDVHDNMHNDVRENMHNDVHDTMHDDLHDNMHDDVNDNMHDKMRDDVHDNMHIDLHEQILNDNHNNIHDYVYDDIINLQDDSDDDDQDDNDDGNNDEVYSAHYHSRKPDLHQPSKYQLFELVVERHNTLKKMLADMKVERRPWRNENDLVYRVGQIERLEDLEDEIAILEDMLASDDEDDIEHAEEEHNADKQRKKSVAFADDDECETYELTFKHTEVEPYTEPYILQKGIKKPSDIYEAFPVYFNSETISILKKPKCDASPGVSQIKPIKEIKKEKKEEVNQDSNSTNTIVVKDVVEKANRNNKNVNQNERPVSLFKKRRQQQLLKE